jgi:hypothetical protein
MHKNAMKCNKTQSKLCINKHGASKIIDTFETYQEHKHKQIRQTIEKGLFNNLDFSRYCDKRDMAIELWIVRYGSESLAGRSK